MPLSTRIFVSASLICGATWLAKTALIASNGGEQTGGGPIGVLWAVGMLGMVTSAAAGAVALTRGRAAWLRGLAAVVAVPASFVLLNVADGLLKAVYPGGGWFRDELALLVVGAALAAGALVVAGRTSERGQTLPAA